MPRRISLDTGNVALQELLNMTGEWAQTDSSDLTADQIAILNLKRIIELKGQHANVGGGATAECFICNSNS